MRKPIFHLFRFQLTIRRWISLGIALFFFLGVASGQTRSELEAERNRIIKEIELAQKALNKTAKSKSEKLKDLRLLEDKIQRREALISNIKLSIEKSKNELANNQKKLKLLLVKGEEIKEQYKQLLRYSYLKKLSTNKWAYLLSAKNLNDAFLRWRYMKQFEQYCLEKSKEIINLQAEIDKNNQAITEDQQAQKILLKNESSQMTLLKGEKTDKNALLQEISKNEQKWKSELVKAKKEREKLNRAIENIIVAELKKRESNTPGEVEVSEVLSEAFVDNKGKFPWPVTDGYISSEFGVQNHPSLKNVKINNNGIDIRAKPGSSIRVIHPGTIIGVTQIPGYDYMIIVQHGNYYTVYSKIASVAVTSGQKISAGTILGRLSREEGILHFEVWKNKSKQNPANWLQTP